MGVIANVKLFYRRRVVDRIIFNIDQSRALGQDHVPELKVTASMAVQFLSAAWYEVRRSTIRNFFLKGGFVPPNLETIINDDDDDADFAAADTERMWEQARNSNLVGKDTSLDEYLRVDNDVLVTEPVTEDTIVQEIQSRDADEDSTSDEDETASSTTTCGSALLAVDFLRNLIVKRGLPAQYFAHLDTVERDVVRLCNEGQVQSKITTYFQ
ncbi:tigger transposable element-derived protein 6-like [Ornithodoros turicata]|uniref:tigger transposable element-derived protein 6-like n=1 Tax=Ornithodoros turicata TaxID=34597 RepID=UPI003138F9A3